MGIAHDYPRRSNVYNAQAASITAAVAFAAVVLTSLVSYTLFHALAELAYVTVVVSVFVVSWSLREFLDDDFPLFLGIALLATGILHLVHLLDFPGFGLISASSDPPTQLWVAATFIESISFVIAPFVLGHRIRIGLVLIAYFVIDGLVLTSIYWWRVFPSALVEGQGLTTFKRTAEYVICAILLAAIFTLWLRRDALARGVFRLLSAALGGRVVAELCFTVYVGPSTWPNLLGHIFLLLSAVLIYQAVVQGTLTRPHALAIANLQLSEEAARAKQRQEEALRRALDQLLALTPSFHGERGSSEVAAAACAAARELFGSSAALLFTIDGDAMTLAAVDPPHAELPGTRVPIDDDPDLSRQIHTRIPTFIGKVHGAPVVGANLAAIRARLALRALLRAPIGIQPRADGLLVLGWSADREQPDAGRLALVQRFCDQVAVALTQARRREMQAEVDQLHRSFESSLLPKIPANRPDLNVRFHYRPGEHRLELGGDYLDVVDCRQGGVAVIVGDVSGHGPDAAALGATLRSGWEALVMSGAEPEVIVATLCDVTERERHSFETFATATLAWIYPDRGELALLNLGQPPPFLICGDQVSTVDVPPMPPLGAFSFSCDTPARISMPKGWRLFFYTDGLIEGRVAPGTAERFGEDRLRVALERLGGDALDERRIGDLLRSVESACSEPFRDDVTAVLISSVA